MTSVEELLHHIGSRVSTSLVGRDSAAIPYVVGICGAPGVGKTTLARRIRDDLAQQWNLESVVASLEDFYLEPEERLARGLRWRAVPGSHDLSVLSVFLKEIDRVPPEEFTVPRFSMAKDRRLPPTRAPAGIDCVVFEGWFVGGRVPGYENLASRIDYLIYLDAPQASLREWRMQREQQLRVDGLGGYSEAQMRLFWDEVLSPGIVAWVEPIRPIADLIFTYDAQHRPVTMQYQSMVRERQ